MHAHEKRHKPIVSRSRVNAMHLFQRCDTSLQDSQDSCHHYTLFTKRTWHRPFLTWHKHYMEFYLLQYVSSESTSSFMCIYIVV